MKEILVFVKCVFLNLSFLVFLLFQNSVFSENITPSIVYSHVSQFSQELNLLRLELGARKTEPSFIIIKNAVPREVFYQALTLCQKTLRLRFERTRINGKCPPAKIGELVPDDVLVQIKFASKNLLAVNKVFDVQKTIDLPEVEMSMESSDVIMAILDVNIQINTLFKRRYLPDDVFREVTLSIFYAAEILKKFPSTYERIPSEPLFKRQKTPKDVYFKLLNIIETIQKIQQLSYVQPLVTIERFERKKLKVTPSDVYDLATLIVSELTYLYWRTGETKIIKSYQPPPKIPAQVFQRIGVLEKQLGVILENVKSNPNWLKRDN